MLDINAEDFVQWEATGMPKWVSVNQWGRTYHVWSDLVVFKGNREEVHSWLAAHGYKQVAGRVAVLCGQYERQGVSHAA